MDTSFKRVDKDDIPLLLEFMAVFYGIDNYPLDYNIAKEILAELISNPSLGFAWMINFNGKPVGYVVLTFGFSLEYHGRDAFIDELFISENYRSLGVGKKSMEFIDEMCLKYSVKTLHLEVERTNTSGQALYKKFNFQDKDRLLLSKRF